jgi:ATP-dependent DNA helicase PIF1
MAPERLTLRVDAQVLLIKNMDENLVNGSMGRVVRFVDPAVWGSEQDVAGVQGRGMKVGDPSRAKAGFAGQELPVVEFIVGKGLQQILVMPETWKVELPSGEVQASRTQVSALLLYDGHGKPFYCLDSIDIGVGDEHT